MSEQRVQEAAAVGFDRHAAEYERSRPGYPRTLLDVLRAHLRLERVCDLAAGTGKLTRLLVEGGAEVVAVEPVAGMRDQLRAALPGIEVLDGTAEAIPLGDASIDVVTVGQAFHWFRADEAFAEIRRVLRPRGGVVIAFNQRDDSVPWVGAWSRTIQWHERPISAYQRTDYRGVLEDAGFVDIGTAEIPWVQPLTRALLADRVRSISYIAAMEPAEQQQQVDAVLALVEGFAETFDLPYVTRAWWATRPE